MLSKGRFNNYIKRLELKKDYCKIIRIGATNTKPKLKDKQFFDTYNLRALYGEPNPNLISDQLVEWSTIATFIIYIAEVENIFYEIFKNELRKYSEFYDESKKQNEFIDFFIKIKTRNDLYPFSEVKQIISRISATDLEYITEIIALRNYFAHGKKENQDLIINKNNPADVALINDLDAINKKISNILEGLIRD